jgi:hypothetical protein
MMDPSKEHSFEDQWKKAFDEASITPPASAWEGVEARLDQSISKPGFDDQWRMAFEEASVIPPVSAWEGIEARLDEEESNKIIPFWWNSRRLWYAAASVAALLVVGGLWLNSSLKNGKDQYAAVVKVQAQGGTEGKTGTVKHNSSETGNGKSTEIKNESLIVSSAAGVKKAEKTERTQIAIAGHTEKPGSVHSIRPGFVKSASKTATDYLARLENGQMKKGEGAGNENSDAPEILDTQSSQPGTVSTVTEPGNEGVAKAQISAEMLAALPRRELDVYLQQRYVFFKPDEQSSAPKAKKHQEYWAGIGLMPASYNPDVNLKTSPASFANKSFASQKSLTGKNDPGFSYAVQTQGGMRISKHWSLETGISYLQGNSNYEGGGYLLDAATYGSSNVLENALADVAYTNKGQTVANAVGNSIYIDVTKQVRNDYRYLQLPVQAGFTLNPDGKLSYSVLGGMMANIFLNNELESANGSVIKTTTSDEVYRGMNWAATTGLRFNYRVAKKWKASLTGSYQKAVTSGFRSNQNLESHPYLYGVSWGMRYSF